VEAAIIGDSQVPIKMIKSLIKLLNRDYVQKETSAFAEADDSDH